MSKIFGFIGCGNMGGALARAVSKAIIKNLPDYNDNIWLYDKDIGRAESLAREIDDVYVYCSVSDSLEEIAENSDYLFLGVKPQVMPEMLADIKDILAKRIEEVVLVTMAAGMSIAKIRELAGGDFAVIRIMPNLAVSVGEGMTLWCSEGVIEEETDVFLNIMRKSGKLLNIKEQLIDAGSAVSGCGPAFAFMFIEALADGGVACGLTRKDAEMLAAQTLLGSAKLYFESGRHPEELKDMVCSPGGTTIEGVLALEKGSFRSDCAGAVIAAYEKTKKLS
ncbi:MAG: pyrroline-5-carboxylate reductase [Clostridia bacterium]|nr:pyrroline-5-carboxylate reductase [Clostridia bacterium]